MVASRFTNDDGGEIKDETGRVDFEHQYVMFNLHMKQRMVRTAGWLITRRD